jgi:hypothetical protein
VQGSQPVLEEERVNVAPLTHELQVLAPSVEETLPGRHGLQVLLLVAPLALEKVPAEHLPGHAAIEDVDPVLEPQVPARHFSGQAVSIDVEPIAVPQVPAGQEFRQAVDLAADHVPAKQLVPALSP